MDDAGRRPERETLEQWIRDFPNYSYYSLDLDKGAAVLVKG